MMIAFKLVERVKSTYPQIIQNGIIIMKKHSDDLFLLKVSLNDNTIWEKEIITKKNLSLISETKENINIYCNRKLQIFEKRTGNILLIKEENMFHLGSDFFIKFERIDESRLFVKMSCFKIETNNVILAWGLPKIDYGKLFNSTTQLFLVNNTNLLSFNLSGGTELWQKEFSDNIQKLEVWKEKVVLVATHGNYITTLYALDAETGDTIWEKEDMSFGFQVQDTFVYCFTQKAFYCINIIDGNVEFEYDLYSKFEANTFHPYTNMTVSGEYVYFSGIMDTVISMWELATGNLVWYYRLYPKENTGRGTDKVSIPAGESPKIYGNRLYQLDGSNTLHIFEREESN